MNEKRQSRLQSNQLSIRQLMFATLSIALGITCLRFSFDRRFAAGSVPNVYLIVIGLSLFVVVPMFHYCQRPNWALLANLLISLALSIFVIVIVLAFLVVSGTI